MQGQGPGGRKDWDVIFTSFPLRGGQRVRLEETSSDRATLMGKANLKVSGFERA